MRRFRDPATVCRGREAGCDLDVGHDGDCWVPMDPDPAVVADAVRAFMSGAPDDEPYPHVTSCCGVTLMGPDDVCRCDAADYD